jgi:hypothetical protein
MDMNPSQLIPVEIAQSEIKQPSLERVFSSIQKRDGRVDDFDIDKIAMAIYKAAKR